MRDKRGNLAKDIKINCSDFDPEEAAALSLKLKKEVRELSSQLATLGLSSRNTVTASLLCTSRQLVLLEKLHRGGQQNFGKTGSTTGEQEKA